MFKKYKLPLSNLFGFCSITVSAVLLLYSDLFAAKRTVDADGGSSYTTINDALQAALSGDTIFIQGTDTDFYDEDFSGECPADITFMSNKKSPDDFPSIRLTGNNWNNWWLNFAGESRFVGLVLNNCSTFNLKKIDRTCVIDRCVIKNFTSEVFHLEGDHSSYLWISNTLFWGNNTIFSAIDHKNVTGPYGLVYNCTFYANNTVNAENATQIVGYKYVLITNCIFKNNGNILADVDLKSLYNNNLVPSLESGWGTGTVYNDEPQFFSTPPSIPSHFRLLSLSPAINGVTGSEDTPSIDITGAIRSGVWDIGAFEYTDRDYRNYIWDISPNPGIQTGSGTWGNDSYWTIDGINLSGWPGSGNSAVFGGEDGTYNITVSGTQNVDSITFDNSGYALSGGKINFGSNGASFISAGKSVTISTVMSGTGGLKLYTGGAPAKIYLEGLNTYTGSTIIGNNVELNANTTANGGQNSSIGSSANNSGNLVLDGGSYRHTGGSVNTNRLFTLTKNGGRIYSSGSGAINFTNTGAITFSGNGARTFELGGGSNGLNNFSPAIGDGSGGATALLKTGKSNTWVLNGNNSYTGVTTIAEGTLIVTGFIAAASVVTVNGTLGGTGAVAGSVNVRNGTIAPGNSGSGTLSTGSLTLDNSSSLDFELGNSRDSIKVNGNLVLDGILNITALEGFGPGDYTLFTYSGSIDNNYITIGAVPADYYYALKTTSGRVTLTVDTNGLSPVLTPEDNSVGISVKSALTMTFNTDVLIGSGNITIVNGSDNSTFEQIDVTGTRVFADSVIHDFEFSDEGFDGDMNATWNPTFAFQNIGSIVDTLSSENILQKVIQNSSLNWSSYDSLTLWVFTTASGIDASVFTQSDGFKWNEGTLTSLKQNEWTRLSYPLSMASDKSSIEGYGFKVHNTGGIVYADRFSLKRTGTKTITIIPTSNMMEATDYYLLIGNGAVKDLLNNNYSGISSKTEWNFTTGLQDYTWDISSSSGFQPGSGTWGTNKYWTNNGTDLVSWPGAGNGAVFAGPDGDYNITVNGTQNVNSIKFNNSGNIINGGTLVLENLKSISVVSGKTATINSTISAAGFTKSGNGELILTADYSGGPLIISSGTLTLGGVSSDGFGTTITVLNDAALQLNNIDRINNFATLDIQSGGTFNLNGNSDVVGYVYGAGSVINNNSALYLDLDNGDSHTFSGTIGGAGNFGLRGNNATATAGKLILTGASTYSGTTVITGGKNVKGNSKTTLQLAKGNNRLPVSTVISFGEDSASGLTGKLILGDSSGVSNQTVAGITDKNGTGTFTIAGGNSLVSTLTVKNNSDFTFSGKIGGTLANEDNICVVKSGNGTLLLSGKNTYTGTTSISSGALLITGSTAPMSVVTVKKNAFIGGTGAITGSVTVNDSGIISPGIKGTGTLSTGNLILNERSILNFELGTNKDSIKINGNLILNGILNITALSGFKSGLYTLITCTGTVIDSVIDIGNFPDGYSGKITLSDGNINLSVVEAGTFPNAIFYAQPVSGVAPLTVSFTDSSTGDIKEFSWDFGDGYLSSVENPQHQYSIEGLYDVKLIVKGPAGVDSTIKSNLIYVYGSDANPVRISPDYLGGADVEITLSNINFIDRLTSLTTDSLGIWINMNSIPVKPGTSQLHIVYSKEKLLSQGNTFKDTLTLPSSGVLYGLMTGLYRQDGSISPFTEANGCLVMMKNTVPPENPLTFSGLHLGGDAATITLFNTSELDSLTFSMVGICLASDSSSLDIEGVTTRWFTVQSIIEGSESDSFQMEIHDLLFTGAVQKVWCAVAVKEKSELISSPVISSIQIKILRNPVALSGEAINSSTVKLNWKKITDPSITSVRIWLSRSEIPVGTIFLSGAKSIQLSPADTIAVISTLNYSTRYYFGAQVGSGTIWSPVTDSSQIDIVTLAPSDTVPVVNTISLGHIVMDTISTNINIPWCLDTTIADSLDIGITYSTRSYPDTIYEPQIIRVSAHCSSAVLKLRESFLFNTTYYISLWLRKVDGVWSPPVSSSRDTITTPGFSRETVTFFNTLKETDTVKAFNGSIILWKDATFRSSDTRTDVIYLYSASSSYNGMIPVGTPFYFGKKDPFHAFFAGIKYDFIPSGYSPGQIQMYRDSAGLLILDYGSTVDSLNGIVYTKTTNLSLPFMLFIDTLSPVIDLQSDTGAVCEAGAGISDTFNISDNIANVSWKYAYGKGG